MVRDTDPKSNLHLNFSMNLLDYSETGLHIVTEAIRKEAQTLDLEATAGELVGLVPLNAIVDAGKFYHQGSDDANIETLVDAAISGLNLDYLCEFNPHERIIEWAAGVTE